MVARNEMKMKHQNNQIKPSRKVFTANYPHFRYWKKGVVEEFLVEEPINIYIHVPFCVQKCAYCYYKTEKLKSQHELDVYVDALDQEIDLAHKRFNFGHRPVHSIYIGGGTPSLLREEMLERIVKCLHKNFSFKNPEFTIEAEPRTINKKKLAFYKNLGVTRISLGIQSFNDEIIKLNGRFHTGEKALRAINMIKELGDVAINIDLLSGLAGETEATWTRSVDIAVETGVHNITVYKMEVYLNTDFFTRSIRKKLIHLPSEDQELGFIRLAIEKFKAADYRPWSFFTFTRHGEFPHQYAANIWKGEDCCAFGPSAFGLLENYNYQNANELSLYLAMIKEGNMPIIRAHKLTSKDAMVRDVLLGMKLYSLSRKDFLDKHGVDFCHLVQDTVEELQAEGYIRVDDNAVTLEAQGILYGDYAGKRLAFALKKYLGLDELSLY